MDVSFIVPAYKPNVNWINDCISAIIRTAENHPQLECEILVGDDGSPGGTADCVDNLGKLSSIVKVFRFPENRGPGPTRNDLISRASGRYIMPQDCDDLMLPFDLSRVVAFMDENPQYVASYSRKHCFDGNGLLNEVHGEEQSPFLAFFQPRVNINCMLIRKKECVEIGGFMPVPFGSINEDVWLMFRLFELSGIHFDDIEPRTLYRMHSSQISRAADAQNDWLWMSHDMLLKHAEETSLIMRGEIPQSENDQQERLISALTGAVFFIHQKNQKLCQTLLEQMLERHPEDFGVWEIYMIVALNLRSEELFDKLYAGAMERFTSSQRRESFVNKALQNAAVHGRDNAKLLELFRELKKQQKVLPEIVAANRPRSCRVQYSWKI